MKKNYITGKTMDEEITENFTYHAQELQTHFSVDHLQKLEQRIIATMLMNKSAYDSVVSQCSKDDFTFIDHKQIMEFFETNNYQQSKETMMDMLDIVPSEELYLDICELLAYSKEKSHALQNYEKDDEKRKIYVKIITKNGDYTALYLSDRLYDIERSNETHCPPEFCDTYLNTINNILPLLQDTDSNPSVIIPGRDSAFDSMWVIVQKDIKSIKVVERLIRWAEDNDIDESLFPRTKEQLSSYSMVELENLGLKDLPVELLSLFLVSLNIKNNQITDLPEGHWHKYYFWSLIACNNHLNSLPQSFFDAKRIKFICLHGNCFESLPKELGDFTELLTLSISNNPIQSLPDSIRNLSGLQQLDIENTLIEILPEWIFEFTNLHKFSCDDKHLPFLLENPEFIKQFDAINIAHSEYAIDHELILLCGLDIDYETWMESNDYQGHGSIMLKRAT